MSASEIDAYVGNRMRQRREALGISQGRLGRHLGLTFSQIQKYEKGSNRIGAGRLYHIAAFLGVTPSHFFEGLDGAAQPSGPGGPGAGPLREEIGALAEAFAAIRDPDTRSSVLALVRSLNPNGQARRLRGD
jgi:transcriptional regulator with XRE-family HTH domain